MPTTKRAARPRRRTRVVRRAVVRLEKKRRPRLEGVALTDAFDRLAAARVDSVTTTTGPGGSFHTSGFGYTDRRAAARAQKDLARLLRDQVPPLPRDGGLVQMLDTAQAWLASPTGDEARRHLRALVRHWTRLVRPMLLRAADDPGGFAINVAKDPARRQAVVSILTSSVREMLADLPAFQAAVATATGLSPGLAAGLGAGMSAGLSTNPRSVPAAVPVGTPPVVVARAIDGRVRDGIARAVLDGDVNMAAAHSAILMAAGLRTLREDCVRAACERDVTRRGVLVEALRERLASASGHQNGAMDVEDVVRDGVPVVGLAPGP